MINETYKAMLTGKSVIRELNEYANDIKQHPHLKMEDIFDYSLGNPSVPVPEAAKDVLRAKILKNMLLEIARQKTPENG